MTQENQHPSPEQENTAADPQAEAAAEPAAEKTPEQEIEDLNQKIGELQDQFLRAGLTQSPLPCFLRHEHVIS